LRGAGQGGSPVGASERRTGRAEVDAPGERNTRDFLPIPDSIRRGIGFDPAYAEKVFGVFKRLHGGDAYPGTGIGLAICRKIVERYGGRIWTESQLGSGAAFYFTLPACPADATSVTMPQPAAAAD